MPKGPVHVCGNDEAHSLCSNCYKTKDKCPVCESQMTKKRNLMVESIVGQMKEKCSSGIEDKEKPEIPEWMKKALECPVCLDIIMDPPVFICDNYQGHSMCSNCHKSIQQNDKMCPVCRGPMGNRRNLGLESLVENIPNKVTCRFQGCVFKRSKGSVVVKHEQSCEYRLVPCGQCNTEIK